MDDCRMKMCVLALSDKWGQNTNQEKLLLPRLSFCVGSGVAQYLAAHQIRDLPIC